MSGVIRTIGGDLPAGEAGAVYAHEHLIIDTPLVAKSMTHIHLPSVEEAVAEVRTCVAVGVRTMVDAMPAASGRHPERLMRVSVLTGMRVVAATGLHTDKYYGDVPWTRTETSEQLAARFIADIEEGIDTHDYLGDVVERSETRAGLVKVGALDEELTSRDMRLFEAAALTAERTGVPVLTHTEAGLGGPHQVEVLLDLGVPAGRVALSHTDKVTDLRYHRDMMESGVYLCYDQGLRDPETTFGLVAALAGEGFADQILLGTDGARRGLWSTLGGSPGLASLIVDARARLTPDLVDRLFVTNPARFLTMAL